MAQEFLDQLRKVPNEDLPTGATCMICHEEYGSNPSGVVEHAVLLPCRHQVGSGCIATWLSPKDGPGNSCPMCRRVFFAPFYNEDDVDEYSGDEDDDDDEDSGDEGEYSDEDDDDGSQPGNHHGDEGEDDDEPPPLPYAGEDDDEPLEYAAFVLNRTNRTPATLQEAFRRLETAMTTTPQAAETNDREASRAWYQRWPLPTAQETSDSLKRARQELQKPAPRTFLQTSAPPSNVLPEDIDEQMPPLASAYRTMGFRETVLYLKFSEAGARIPPLRFPHQGLSAHQEEMLLWEMGQRGAFRGVGDGPRHMAMTNRQAWYVHRGKGEVYVYQGSSAGGRGGYWSTDLGYE